MSEIKFCPECGKKTDHYHIGFLDGAKNYVCPRCCFYKDKEPCKDIPMIGGLKNESN